MRTIIDITFVEEVIKNTRRGDLIYVLWFLDANIIRYGC
jgi:hypothetical protein